MSPPDERTGPREKAGSTSNNTIRGTTVPRRYDRRAERVRRWARLSLDDLLDDEPGPRLSAWADLEPLCDGRHHRGEPHDLWRTCTGLAYGLPERDRRGRDLAAAGWAAP